MAVEIVKLMCFMLMKFGDCVESIECVVAVAECVVWERSSPRRFLAVRVLSSVRCCLRIWWCFFNVHMDVDSAVC